MRWPWQKKAPAPRRFCEDCVHFQDNGIFHATCGRNLKVSRTGQGTFCEVERMPLGLFDRCGPQGRYWQKREEGVS